MKKHIPNILTFGNLFCGFLACIFLLMYKSYDIAFMFLIIGIVCDFLDGFVARLLNVSSELGVQLDSLADMITAGVLPSLVIYNLLLFSENVPIFSSITWAFLCGGFIAMASAYRLAKFNIDTRQTTGFIGLPTPANALLICSLGVISKETDIQILRDILANFWVLLVVTLLCCYLLNSEIRLFALKFKNFRLADNKQKYIFVLFSVVVFALLQILAVPIIILAYILFSILWKEVKD